MNHLYKKALKCFTAVSLTFMLPACAETQLVAHYTKKMMGYGSPSARTAGTYKVGNPYKIKGRWYTPQEKFQHSETGIASWYGPGFHGKKTANGETYDQYELTAAHRTLQLPSLVKVTNLENGKSVVVRINDRGPFAHGRIIDMSRRGAELLGFKNKGTARVRVTVLEEASRKLASAAKAGQDTSRIDVASLMRQPAPQPQPRIKVAEAPRQVYQPVTLEKRKVVQDYAVLRNDARALPLPESLQSTYLINDAEAVPVQAAPTGLTLDPIEASVVKAPPVAEQPVAKNEMAFLKELDFMKESGVQGHEDQGRFVPDPVVTQGAIEESHIYVQAGAFSNYQNAEMLATKLSKVGVVNINAVDVSGQKLYRVRVGPMNEVSEADIVLAQVIDQGHQNARIVVD